MVFIIQPQSIGSLDSKTNTCRKVLCSEASKSKTTLCRIVSYSDASNSKITLCRIILCSDASNSKTTLLSYSLIQSVMQVIVKQHYVV